MKHYSRRELYALGETLGESVTRMEAGRRIYGGGGGVIVNTASTEGLGATPLISAYTASKHGVIVVNWKPLAWGSNCA